MCTEHTNQTKLELKSLPAGKGKKCKYCDEVWGSIDGITIPKKLALDTPSTL